MSRVPVSEDILRWAMDRSERPPDVLVRKFPKIREWLSGERHPTLRQLERFAKATFTPLGYLFLKEPPIEKLPIQHFRTLGDETVSRPSPDLLDTIHSMQRRQLWMREYLIDEGQDRLSFIGSAQKDEGSESLALKIRQTLGLDDDWAGRQSNWSEAFRFLCEKSQAASIIVVVNGVVGNNTHRRLNPGEFRGFVLVDDYAPLVFINGADSKAAQMFTLAHELAHLFYGSSAAFDLREMRPADDPSERACNIAAAEFLVPERNLREIWHQHSDSPEPFDDLARNFKVSVLVAARRALDLHLITKEDFFDFYDDYLMDERRKAVGKKSGGNFYNNQNFRVGKPFASAVIHAVKEGKLLYSEAYRLTDLYGKSFDKYASLLELGGTL